MNNGNGPPARMQICLSPGRETENLFGVALQVLFLTTNNYSMEPTIPISDIDKIDIDTFKNNLIDIVCNCNGY